MNNELYKALHMDLRKLVITEDSTGKWFVGYNEYMEENTEEISKDIALLFIKIRDQAVKDAALAAVHKAVADVS